MSNEEIWRCTDLRQYKFETIPEKVFDEYRRELAEMAAFLRNEQAPSTGTPEDLNTQPETFEGDDEVEQLMTWLVEQAEIGHDIADGEAVVLEVSSEQWNLLVREGLLTQRDSRRGRPMQVNQGMYLLIPSGFVEIKVGSSNDKD